jgi:Tfp pilus assembly protein PilF
VAFKQGDPERAVKHLEQALELPEALYLLACAQEVLAMNRKGTPTQACDTLHRYLDTADFDPDSVRLQDAQERFKNLRCGE